MNAYDRMTMGDVDIMGDPAAAVQQQEPKFRYVEKEYQNCDEIQIGIGGGAVALVPNTPTQFQVQVNTPFKPNRVVIPSSLQPNLYVVQIAYGPYNFIDGAPVPSHCFSEVSTENNKVNWPTVQTSQNIIFTLVNRGLANIFPSIALKGLRLR